MKEYMPMEEFEKVAKEILKKIEGRFDFLHLRGTWDCQSPLVFRVYVDGCHKFFLHRQDEFEGLEKVIKKKLCKALCEFRSKIDNAINKLKEVGKCKDCKWWKSKEQMEDDELVYLPEGNFGECSNETIENFIKQDTFAPAPDFGCILFKKKETEK